MSVLQAREVCGTRKARSWWRGLSGLLGPRLFVRGVRQGMRPDVQLTGSGTQAAGRDARVARLARGTRQGSQPDVQLPLALRSGVRAQLLKALDKLLASAHIRLAIDM